MNNNNGNVLTRILKRILKGIVMRATGKIFGNTPVGRSQAYHDSVPFNGDDRNDNISPNTRSNNGSLRYRNGLGMVSPNYKWKVCL
jgi:hypothetical protein